MITGLSGAGAGGASGFGPESVASATGDAVTPTAAGGVSATIAAGCEAATATPITLGSLSRCSVCAVEFPLLVPDKASFAGGFCEAALCELVCVAPAPCAPAVLELVRLEFVRWITEPLTGVMIFGRADAADSVPGPAFEKKTENGVWLAIGGFVAEPAPAAAVVEIETGALGCAVT